MNPNDTPSHAGTGAALVPLYVSGVFREAPAMFRVQLIECLMKPMGALGLVAVASGVFAALRQRHGWHHLQVTLDDAMGITGDQVLELSSYLQQTAPEIFQQVGDLVTRQPALTGSLSAILLLHVLRRAVRRS